MSKHHIDFNNGTAKPISRYSGNQYAKREFAGIKMVNGYISISHKGIKCSLHQLVFYAYHGFLPEFIDHVDRDRSNNSISNLRPATINENNRNMGMNRRNKSGFKGVHFDRARGKFVAKITVNNKAIFLGRFSSAEEAHNAYAAAAKKHFGQFSFAARADKNDK